MLREVCTRCVESLGLCTRCAETDRAILPQLKEPFWYRDAHSGLYYEVKKDQTEQDPRVLKAKRRKERRLNRAMNGEHTRSRKAA